MKQEFHIFIQFTLCVFISFLFCDLVSAAFQPDSSEALKAGTAFVRSRIPEWKKKSEGSYLLGKRVSSTQEVKTTTERITGHSLQTSEFADGALQLSMTNPNYSAIIRKEKPNDKFRVISTDAIPRGMNKEIAYSAYLQGLIDGTVTVAQYQQDGNRHHVWLKYKDPALQFDPTQGTLPGQFFLLFEVDEEKDRLLETRFVFENNINTIKNGLTRETPERLSQSVSDAVIINQIYRNGKLLNTRETAIIAETYETTDLTPEMCRLEYYGLTPHIVATTDFGRGRSWRFYTAIGILAGIGLLCLLLYFRKRMGR